MNGNKKIVMDPTSRYEQVGLKGKSLSISLLLAFFVLTAFPVSSQIEQDHSKPQPVRKADTLTGRDLIQVERDTLIYYTRHTVKRKETLHGISTQYGVSIDELLLLNPILSAGLRNGQIIKIPVKDPGQFKSSYSGTMVLTSYVKEPVKKDTVPAVIPASVPCRSFEYGGEAIHVALLLPLYLNDIADIVISDSAAPPPPQDFRAFNFIQFYEGACIALDSLAKEGMNIELHVYDVSEDTYSVNHILGYPGFSDMDLIIGPVFKKSFRTVAEFADIHQIPIVNPFTHRNDVIIDHSSVYKVQPSFYGQLNHLLDYFTIAYPDANYILIHQNWSEDRDTLTYLRNRLSARITGMKRISKADLQQSIENAAAADTSFMGLKSDSLYTDDQLIHNSIFAYDPLDSLEISNRVKEIYFYQDGVSGLVKKLSLVRENVLISVSTDRVFVADMMSHIQGLTQRYNIIMAGMPHWNDYTLELEYAMKLNLHLFSNEMIDYTDENVIRFVTRFRYQYENEPLPEYHAFLGYDIMFFFLKAIKEYGPDFSSCLPYLFYQALQYGFDFHRQGDGGFENNYSTVFKFEDYRLVRVR